MDDEDFLPLGDLLLSPIRKTTFTRSGRRAIVFAESGRKYYGCYFHNDKLGWQVCEWFKPTGTWHRHGQKAGMDLNLTQRGIEK